MARIEKRLLKATEAARFQRSYRQRLNPDSLLQATPLSRLSGMQRVKVTHASLPPGHDSFALHRHMVEEEWVYILSGRGIAIIGEDEFEVGAGDFMGFPANTEAHLLRNPYDEPLEYLMGGEDAPLEVVYYPAIGKRYLVMAGDRGADFYELGTPIQPFGRADRDEES